MPTDSPGADGTSAWTSTTIVIVEASGGGQTGLGYAYTSGTATGLVAGKLAESVRGVDAALWDLQGGKLNNDAWGGIKPETFFKQRMAHDIVCAY